MPQTNSNTNQRGTLALLRGLVPRRTVTEREALQLAELQANRLRRHLGVTEASFPNEALDVPRLRIRRDPDLPTSGMTFWSGTNWIIVLNSTEAVTRQRFSLMHEFKHIIDHTAKHHLYQHDTEAKNPAAEKAADYFAACLLMPKMLVKRHWGEGPRNPAALARTFAVSPAAMKYRLDQLGLNERPRRCDWTRSTYMRVRPRNMEAVT